MGFEEELRVRERRLRWERLLVVVASFWFVPWLKLYTEPLLGAYEAGNDVGGRACIASVGVGGAGTVGVAVVKVLVEEEL